MITVRKTAICAMFIILPMLGGCATKPHGRASVSVTTVPPGQRVFIVPASRTQLDSGGPVSNLGAYASYDSGVADPVVEKTLVPGEYIFYAVDGQTQSRVTREIKRSLKPTLIRIER